MLQPELEVRRKPDHAAYVARQETFLNLKYFAFGLLAMFIVAVGVTAVHDATRLHEAEQQLYRQREQGAVAEFVRQSHMPAGATSIGTNALGYNVNGISNVIGFQDLGIIREPINPNAISDTALLYHVGTDMPMTSASVSRDSGAYVMPTKDEYCSLCALKYRGQAVTCTWFAYENDTAHYRYTIPCVGEPHAETLP